MDSELGLMRFFFFPSNLSEFSIFSDHLFLMAEKEEGRCQQQAWFLVPHSQQGERFCLVGHRGFSVPELSSSLAYTISHYFGNLSRKIMLSLHIEASTFQRDDLNNRSDL